MMDEKQSFLGSSVFMHLRAMVILCSKYRIHDGMQEICQSKKGEILKCTIFVGYGIVIYIYQCNTGSCFFLLTVCLH